MAGFSRFRALSAVVAILAGFSAGLADRDSPPAELMARLGSPSPEERDSAESEILRRGAECLEPLREMAASPDLHVRAASQDLIARIEERVAIDRLAREDRIHVGVGLLSRDMLEHLVAAAPELMRRNPDACLLIGRASIIQEGEPPAPLSGGGACLDLKRKTRPKGNAVTSIRIQAVAGEEGFFIAALPFGSWTCAGFGYVAPDDLLLNEAYAFKDVAWTWEGRELDAGETVPLLDSLLSRCAPGQVVRMPDLLLRPSRR